MRDRLSVVLRLVLCGSLLAGCATGSSGKEASSRNGDTFAVRFRTDAPPAKRVIPAPVPVVWAAMPQAFADMGYPGGPSARPDERVYLTRPLTIQGQLYNGERNSDYLNCGQTPVGTLAADEYEVKFAIVARVSAFDADSTLVEVLVDGTARDRTRFTSVVNCAGTGRLEAALLQRLEKRTGVSVR
jgi:hypothetical protein